jgi:UDP-3-O-[3-hydroxymyristoyl] glucosamine N-acyltransferase
MTHSLAEVAQALGARLDGDGGLPIDGAAEPSDAGPRDLALAMSPAYAAALSRGRARAALLWEGAACAPTPPSLARPCPRCS